MTDTVDIRLRRLEAADSGRVLAWRNLPEIRRWMYTDHLISQPEHDRWFAGALVDGSCCYWIVELDRRPVGLANLADVSPAQKRATWAYYLADPAVRGRGVGAYIEFFVLEHVFTTLGLNKLWCEVLVENEAVWKLHQAFGFQREALLRQHAWKDGVPCDVVGLGLLAAEWAAVREDSRQRLQARGLPA
ncbi:UDP-4-amino-4,6-dideoxy-N-acetyl-beta-L-altrosamine N-acetyltransferase [Phenylobacterium sp.]|uniref:UDP-4-amino-4, 6-dideoxy-N-acetyl-beta-L-altrosamine N-acetyltransferase n=1 Tax=Phenylobacterium sp. TaxID=1871053 RepID=UPI002F41714E